MEMRPNIATGSNSTEKIYSVGSIYGGTFLGGPLVAGYMLAHNFNVFGQKSKATTVWLYTLTILFALILIPEDIKIPSQLIPAIYLGMTVFIIQRFQTVKIKAFQKSGGQTYKSSKPVLITIGGLLLTLVVLISPSYFYQTFVNTEEIRTYGKTNNEIIYYKKEILISQVDQVADLLSKIKFFDDIETTGILINKVDSTYEIHVSIGDGFQNTPETTKTYSLLRQAIQTVFPNNKVVKKSYRSKLL